MLAKKSLGAQSGGYGRIGCDIEIYNEIAEIANECGYKLTELTNALLNYALAHSEIVEETRIIKTFKIGTEGELNDDHNQ